MRWRRRPEVLWRTAPGYLVLAAVGGTFVEVGGPGADIWLRLADWVDEGDLAATLADDYGADLQIVSPDVHALLEELHGQGYVDREG